MARHRHLAYASITPGLAARYERRFPRGRALRTPGAASLRSRFARAAAALPVRAVLSVALVLAGVLEWVQAAFTFAGDHRLIWFHQDFPALYAAGRLVLDGAGDRLYDTQSIAAAEIAAAGQPVGATGVLGYFNPPFFAALMAPISLLSLDEAYRLWTAGSLALVALDAWLLWRIAGRLPRPARSLVVLAFLTTFPLTYGLQIGQFSLILLTSWAAAYLLLRSAKPHWAGVALAPLLIKPELLILVAAYLLWKRQFAVFTTLAPLSAIAIALSLHVVGLTHALDYPRYLLDSTTWSGSGIATNVMFDWNGLVAMAWDPSEAPLALVIVGGLTVITVVAVMCAVRGPFDLRSERFAVQWALLTVATVLVDPHLYLQDTILLAPAVAALLCVAPSEKRGWIAGSMFVGWLVLAAGVYPNEHLHVNAFTVYLAAWAIVLLAWASSAAEVRRVPTGARGLQPVTAS